MSENQATKAAAAKESIVQRIKRALGLAPIGSISIYDQPYTAPTMQMLHDDITLMPGLVASLMPAAAELCTARYRDGFSNADVVAVAVDLAIRTIKAGNKAAENFYEAMHGEYVSPEVIESREQMATIDKEEAPPVADDERPEPPPPAPPPSQAAKSDLFDLTELPFEKLPTSERADHVDVAPLPDPAPVDKPVRRRKRSVTLDLQLKTAQLITPEEARLWLNMKLHDVYSLVGNGMVPHYRVGRLIFFDIKELGKWLWAGAKDYQGDFNSRQIFVNHRGKERMADHFFMA